MKTKIFISKCLILIIGTVVISCSSSFKQADIPSSANPHDEIKKLNRDLAVAITENIDVLAPREFKKSIKWLQEAKSDLSSKQDQDEILDDLRNSRGYLQVARQVSQNRAEKAPGLFRARQSALKAGAAKHPRLFEDFKDLDDEVSANADNLTDVDSQELAEFQARYVNFERKAIILKELGGSMAIFNGAKKDKAQKLAPMTYKKAVLSLRTAESIISTNVRNPAGYRAAVNAASNDVTLLKNVVNTIKRNSGNLSESAALKLVAQSSKIKRLDTELSKSTAENRAEQSRMDKRNQVLTQKLEDREQDLDSANVSAETQRAIETARLEFSPDEAEAYQQGGSLLIRLKQVNFASGRSDIPGDSLAILAKVLNVAKSMNASEIKIEGHTDSTGSAAQNKIISENRAASVASYFRTNGFDNVKVEGHGFQKPIASNKSKEGRTLNRRVDIIISPESASATK